MAVDKDLAGLFRWFTFAVAAELDADAGQDGGDDGASGGGSDQVDQPVVADFSSSAVKILQSVSNEAVSYVNTPPDGCTFPE